MNIQGLIALIISIGGLIFAGHVLLSKSSFEQVFMTPEQISKQRIYAVLGGTLYFTFLVPALYIGWTNIINTKEIDLINWDTVKIIAVNTFIISLVFLGGIIKVIRNFVAKTDIKYKVVTKDLGELFLIKMLDKDICICSKSAQIDLNNTTEEIYLIKIDDFTKLPLIREEVAIQNRSIYQKIFE